MKTKHTLSGLLVLCVACLFSLPLGAQESTTPSTPVESAHDHAGHDHDPSHDHDHASEPHVITPWDKATVDTFARLPIQDGGRVKPLSTFARFELIKFSGRSSLKLENGTRLSPTEWLLYCFFEPGLALDFKVLQIENPAVMQDLHLEFFRITALQTPDLAAAKQLQATLEARNDDPVSLDQSGGLYSVSYGRFPSADSAEAVRQALAAAGIATQGVAQSAADENMKRGTFSYLEIAGHIDALTEKARAYADIDSKQRTLVQNQVLTLYSNFSDLNALLTAFDFGRLSLPVAPGGAVADALAASGQTVPPAASYTQLLAALPRLLDPFREKSAEQLLSDPATSARTTELVEALKALETAARTGEALTILPATGLHADPTWLSPGAVYSRALPGREDFTPQLGWLAQAAQLPALAADRPALATAAAALEQSLRTAAIEKGEYPKLGLEIFFYKLKFFLFNPWLFTLAFLVVALTWMFPRSQGLARTAWVAVLIPTLLLIFGITLRCIIRGRPPITTLYETTLFIPAVAIALGLIFEHFDRRRIALSVSSVLGVVGLFIANKYELSEGGDTMGSLIAVLNSNFWLSTHVTTVTMGYSAGLLAAGLAHVYLLGRLFGLKRGDRNFYKAVVRMTYGVLCFGLIFSFIGTVLGGIWANYSWGRFWGWDPKENGALLIIIWELMILHGRMGGYFRDIGLCAMSVLLGIVVSFSWWGVNLLGVGLHSYGFMEGGWSRLGIFWAIELLVTAAAIILWFRDTKTEPATPIEV